MAGTIADRGRTRAQAGDEGEGDALWQNDDRAGDTCQEVVFQRAPRDRRPPAKKGR